MASGIQAEQAVQSGYYSQDVGSPDWSWCFFQKYRKEMEDIGHAPTVEKEYEMLRKAVTNPNLKSILIKLNLPPAKRISLDDFFEDCLYVVRTSKELDTGRDNGNGEMQWVNGSGKNPSPLGIRQKLLNIPQ